MSTRSSKLQGCNEGHFDRIAARYYSEIPEHIRVHLSEKWWKTVSHHFKKDSEVLDIGCGEGSAVSFLRAKDIKAVGIDSSPGLIAAGKRFHPEIEKFIDEGNALDLGFADGAFDFALMTGVLHHIPKKSQFLAVREALRVVKDGGAVIIRESNLRNPLFRIFWNYIFPLTSKIDKFGGENWIAEKHFSIQGFPVEAVSYFTFVPNFTPKALLPLATAFEKKLEGSRLRTLAAHYVVVLRKTGGEKR